jgi:hypothetical protein
VQAAVIDFTVQPENGTKVTYTGANLSTSSMIDLTKSMLQVQFVGGDDNSSGLSAGSTISITPTDIDYSAGVEKLGTDVVKAWTAVTGPFAGDTFTETLTNVVDIEADPVHLPNSITILLSGEVTSSGPIASPFDGTSATLLLSANQDAGAPNGSVGVTITNFADSGSGRVGTPGTPEPSTWVMMMLRFAGRRLRGGPSECEG